MVEKNKKTKKAKKQKEQGENMNKTNNQEVVEEVKNNQEMQQEKVNNSEADQELSEKIPIEEQLAEKDQKINELQEKYLRLTAEFDNFRKRTTREKIELMKSAGEDVLAGLLPVIDDFERGLGSIDKSGDIDSVKEGISLIYNKFKEFIKQKGVKEIDAMHKEFDTDLHDAVTKIPAPEEELKGKVVDVIEKGYLLNDKVIRYSKVVVGE
ncbi:MAG: nucleotide exchange factor GrpE [Bacteroidales bacterium]